LLSLTVHLSGVKPCSGRSRNYGRREMMGWWDLRAEPPVGSRNRSPCGGMYAGCAGKTVRYLENAYFTYFTNPASWLPHWNKRLSCNACHTWAP